jgi:hypothetical protein
MPDASFEESEFALCFGARAKDVAVVAVGSVEPVVNIEL